MVLGFAPFPLYTPEPKNNKIMSKFQDLTKEQMEAIENFLDTMFDQYVPSSGAAETVGGEIVRACNRILYRWYNDGDIVGSGYGKVTVNPPARYLGSIFSTRFDIHLNVCEFAVCGFHQSQDDYEQIMYNDMSKAVEVLKAHPELFEETNNDDMWDYRDGSNDWDDDDEF